MKNEHTCGECRKIQRVGAYWICKEFGSQVCEEREASNMCFKPKKKPTNGDKIRQGGNRALADFQQLNTCDNCIYNNGSRLHNYCEKPIDKTCTDGIEAWLNAPAESEEQTK